MLLFGKTSIPRRVVFRKQQLTLLYFRNYLIPSYSFMTMHSYYMYVAQRFIDRHFLQQVRMMIRLKLARNVHSPSE